MELTCKLIWTRASNFIKIFLQIRNGGRWSSLINIRVNWFEWWYALNSNFVFLQIHRNGGWSFLVNIRVNWFEWYLRLKLYRSVLYNSTNSRNLEWSKDRSRRRWSDVRARMYELINRIIVRGMQTAYKRVEKDGSIRVLDHLRGRCVAVHVHLSRIVIAQRSRLITAFDNCSFYRDARPIERCQPTCSYHV